MQDFPPIIIFELINFCGFLLCPAWALMIFSKDYRWDKTLTQTYRRAEKTFWILATLHCYMHLHLFLCHADEVSYFVDIGVSTVVMIGMVAWHVVLVNRGRKSFTE
jgi:hypothetical protein